MEDRCCLAFRPISCSDSRRLREVEFDTALFWEKDWGQEDCDDEDESDENEGNDIDVTSKDKTEDRERNDEAEAHDDKQNDTPSGYPSLLDLLRSSLLTLEQITLHVPAQRGDHICLKRLLNGIPALESQENESKKLLPKLTHLKVVLYHQDHGLDSVSYANQLVARTQRFLYRFEEVVNEAVPYGGTITNLWPEPTWSGPSGSAATRSVLSEQG